MAMERAKVNKSRQIIITGEVIDIYTIKLSIRGLVVSSEDK